MQARSEELYFISATVACRQLQQSGAYPTNEVSMNFTWWPFRRGGPPEDAEQRKWLVAPHQRKWLLVQVKKHHQQKWLLAPHQWKLLLMRILPKSQDPEADGGPDDKLSLAPTDPEAPPSTVGGDRPTEAERLAQSWCESCVRGCGGCVCRRGRAACVDVVRISLT